MSATAAARPAPGPPRRGTAAPQRRRRRPNLARLNHVLVPGRSDERDRFRRGAVATVTRPVWWIHGALSREGRAAVGLTLLVAAAGLDVGHSQVYLLWAALSGLLLGSLVMRPFYSMRGAKVRVETPRRATAHEDVTFAVAVTASRTVRSVRVETPFLPWDGRWTGVPRGIPQVDAGQTATTTATARFIERGEHHLDPFLARALVPLGLAAGSAARTSTCRFLVLPRVARVESIALQQGSAGDRRRIATQAPATDGDLAGVRPYRAGDSIRHLHARTWARTGEPHVREHVRERSERAAMVLMADGTSDEALVEAAVSLAAGVAASLVRGEAGIGVVALGGQAIAVAAGGSPRAALDDVLDRLATWSAPRVLSAADVMDPLGALASGVSTAVVVTADRDRAPGELPPAVAEVAAALRSRGIGVRVAMVIEEEDGAGSDAEVARVSRGMVERLEPIRL